MDGKTTKMVATGLFPNEFYGFRVIAVNESGESAPSKTLDVDTLEEPEEEEEEHMVSRFTNVLVPLLLSLYSTPPLT